MTDTRGKKKPKASKPEKSQRKIPLQELALLSEKLKKFDPNATIDDCVKDLRRVQEAHPNQHISRMFYRAHGRYSDATWNSMVGNFTEFRRQAGLELTRGQHKLERDIAKQASLDIYREFYSKEVLPYHAKHETAHKRPGRFKTILVGSDFHDLESDPFVLSVFLDTAKRLQPDVIVLNGDIFDLYEASRFDQDIRQVKIVERFNFVKRKIFKPLRESCPDSEITLIAGNHEFRLLTTLSHRTPALRVILSDVMGLTLADMFGLDEFKINLVCKLNLAAFNNTDVKAELTENYKVFFGAFVCSHFKDLSLGLSGTSGHTHRPELVTFANIPMGKLSWTTTGCIARTRAEYVQGMDCWTNSFMVAHIDTEKKFVSPEHFLIPSDFVVIHGIKYERRKPSKN